MGYGVNKFVGKIDQNLLCNICVGVIENAITTICGHSFCEKCLQTWLSRPEINSCPSCRSHVLELDLIPVHALRGLVDGLLVTCENAEHGCDIVIRMDNSKTHLESCPYGQVNCKACGEAVKRLDLISHQEKCDVLSAMAAEARLRAKEPTMESLSRQVAELEVDLQNTKSTLRESEGDVQRVKRNLREMQYRLERTVMIEEEQYDPDWDPDYAYGYSPSSIAQLASLISRYLLNKPYYVDRNRIFNSVKRCFEYYHSYASYSQDVHMLLATTYASNWFTENQRCNFDVWLRSLARERFFR